MVGRPRFERGTNGLKVRCSTSWANYPFRKSALKAKKTSWQKFLEDGGSSAIRTRDQRIKSPLLYQLS